MENTMEKDFGFFPFRKFFDSTKKLPRSILVELVDNDRK